MNKEFVLSDKMQISMHEVDFFKLKDVKEFIRLLKEQLIGDQTINSRIIDKLAGESLI